MPVVLNIGDIVELKKKHPCGSYKFKITRTGMDFRIKCLQCEKELWLSRTNLERRIKKIEPNVEE